MSNDVAVEQTTTRSRIGNRVLWVMQVVVGVDFIVGGLAKLGGLQRMVDLFDHIGAGHWLRYFVGVVEIFGGIGILIPKLSGLAATGLALLMVGALYTNVVLIDESWAPLAWLVIVAIIAWRRWPQTKALLSRFRR
ncbi:DoxX family protein [Dactylosporangium sp. NPDC050688]|uniref:DoxX family protein n=1 Tax=Dactylosporangium sp. NPDC050688 TaxID=3157217 RepID=UPI0033EF4BD5